jgi:hypothetical protein
MPGPSTGEGSVRGTEKREVTEEFAVHMPGMVFAGRGTDWYLWAVKEREFTTAAQVWEPPLPNVHPGGAICWGANTMPVASGPAVLDAWRLFIGSPFNDHLAGGRSKAFPNDVRGQLAERARSKREYPLNDLVKSPRWGSIGDAVLSTVNRQEVWR